MQYVYKFGWLDDGSLAIFVASPMGSVMVMSFQDITEYDGFMEQAVAFRGKIADVGIPKIMVEEVNK